MIDFPCHCSHKFSVPDDTSGGTIQCPDCGRLNDIPLLSDLAHLHEDGTYDLGDNATPAETQARLAEIKRAFAREQGGERGSLDLRPTREQFLTAGETARGERYDEKAALTERPKYDPVTGERVKPLDLAKDDQASATDIPMAKAALTYSTDRVHRRLSPGRIALELLMPVNIAVMLFVYLAQALVEIPVMWLNSLGMASINGLLISAPISALIIAHYGNVIEETGPEGRDELPRPLRNLHLSEDMLTPFGRAVTALALCYVPTVLALIYARQLGPTAPLVATICFTLGSAVLPGVAMTIYCSGSLHNLRPDRLVGTIIACGGSYVITILAWFAALAGVIWINGVDLLRSSGLLARHPWMHVLSHSAIVFPSWMISIYLLHFFCCLVGVMYRHHHDDFPWILQRHVRDPMLNTRGSGMAQAARRGQVNGGKTRA